MTGHSATLSLGGGTTAVPVSNCAPTVLSAVTVDSPSAHIGRMMMAAPISARIVDDNLLRPPSLALSDTCTG